MLEVIFRLIPKTTNEFTFVLGVVGLCVLSLKKRKSVYIYIVLCIIFAMIIWRAVYGIKSARYASCLIYLFTIPAGFFLSSLIRSKHRKIAFFAYLIALGLTLNWVHKNYTASRINSSVFTIAQLHDDFNDENNILITLSDDASRIFHYEKMRYPIVPYYGSKTDKDLSSFINNYSYVNRTVLYDLIVNSDELINVKTKKGTARFKHIVSFFTQNKKKRHCIYLINPIGSYQVVSNNATIEPESGILKNGDIESVDLPMDSYEKLKKNISNYELFYNFDPQILTPKNAYFYNASRFTQTLPCYKCSDLSPLSGSYSVYMRINDGYGYVFFEQKFSNGTYVFSALVKGKKGTRVRLIYDAYQKKKWNPISVAEFIIPDNRMYKIKSTFNVDDLEKQEYFLVGGYIKNGEAFLDNFNLYEGE